MLAQDFIKEAQEHQKGKVCIKCKEHKQSSEFSNDKSKKDGLDYKCKSCRKEYNDNRCRFRVWFINKKSHAKADGTEFTIEPEDILNVKIRETITIDGRGRKHYSWEATEYPKVCSKWGIELDWGMNGLNWNSPSLDRIDPTKGYVKGNVRLVCQSYNGAKSNCPPDKWDVVEKNMARFVLFGNN